MEILIVISIVALSILFYSYLGYGIVLFALVQIKRFFAPRKPVEMTEWPEVTMLVAAYNEQDCVEDKIRNSLSLSYPSDKIKFLFVTDGSTDKTNEIITKYPAITLEHRPERKGKLAAVERVMKSITSPITIFTDANTLLNNEAITNMVRHFADPSVGAVAGEKRIEQTNADDASAAGEGIYWKYESKLKQWDSELHSVVGAAGELFAVRTSLYEPVPADTLIEDFVLTMGIAAKGHRVVYEAQSYALETASLSITEEIKRKVRIAAGGLQAVGRMSGLLNPFPNPVLTFQYVSHRALRWTLAPLMLPLLLVTSFMLALQGYLPGTILFVAQIAFYVMAAVGYILEKRKTRLKILYIPLYFTIMNVSVFRGLWRLINGKQSAVWEKAQRKLAV
ncbi:MAG: glycosyltransferase family 2 protein [Imperialibacter sp.]|uniref:glycosyltransferase family 2 protein n=1 Tax=Imperialibacter sp. TaxID=2038411 RepID=UPI0030DBC9B9|tara:strand:+ start:176 stop:1354 length:1179 start_codon:yes stop_codon:yes gene_type:complete